MDKLVGTNAHLLRIMLDDALDSVLAIYGDEGLQKVIANMGAAHRAREHNAEIDRLEKQFGSLTEGDCQNGRR